MSSVNVNTNNATVTEVRPFPTRQGQGADFFVEAKGDATVYLQVVLFDAAAKAAVAKIQKGDAVDVSGRLKCKMYMKRDGSTGFSLIVENPDRFEKTTAVSELTPQPEESALQVQSETALQVSPEIPAERPTEEQYTQPAYPERQEEYPELPF